MSQDDMNMLGQDGQERPPHTTAPTSAPTPSSALQLPGVDMSALAGVSPEQMALIARLFQAGALPLPPVSLATSDPVTVAPTQAVTGSDREDGELEDGERSKGTSTQALALGAAQPLKQRKAEVAKHASDGQDPRVSNSQLSKESAAKQFVSEMVRAGYSFEQLARHVDNDILLRRLFMELNLLGPESEAPDGKFTEPAASTVHPSLAQVDGAPKPPTGMAKRLASSNVKAVDRSEYLARLQAAKNKRTEAVGGASTPTEPLQAQVTVAKAVPETPRTKAIAFGQLSPTSKMEKDKLLRARLAAVKAEYAAKQAAKQGSTVLLGETSILQSQQTGAASVDAPLAPVSHGLGANITSVSSQTAQQVNALPESHQMRSNGTSAQGTTLPGLPGLSMTVSSAQVPTSGSSQPSPPAVDLSEHTPLANPRKRPVAADFDDFPASSTPNKRPFGQSRGNSEDESMIIEDSDGDEDDDDDTDNAESSGHQTDGRSHTRAFRDIGPLSDFPPRTNHLTRASVPGTPGDITPGGLEYLRVRQEIEDMQRKIAEMEKRKVATKSSAAVQGSATSTPTMPVHSKANETHATTLPPSQGSLQSDHSNVKAPQSVSNTQLEKLRLQQRIQELDGLRDAKGRGLPGLNSSNSEPHLETAEPGTSQVDRSFVTKGSMDHLRDHGTQPSSALDDDMPDDHSDESISNFYHAQPTSVEDDAASVHSEQSTSDSMSESSDEGNADNWQETDLQTVVAGATENAEVESEAENMSTEAPEVSMEEAEASSIDDIAGNSPPEQVLSEKTSLVRTLEHDGHRSISDSDKEVVSPGASAIDSDDHEPLAIPGKVSLNSTPGLVDHSTPESLGDFAKDKNGRHGVSVANDAADDLAPELQPSQEQQASLSNLGLETAATRHIPYVSPLAAFKDFRFHPRYLQSVPGGFKSLTYSHNIDMNQPICPYEAAGGQCNDKSCMGQHFSAMALSDSDLLRRFCTQSAPVHSDEDRMRWNSGLKALIQELTRENLPNDVELIAARIAEYRRQFVGDPSKVLHLG